MNKKCILLMIFPITLLTTGCNKTPKMFKPSFAAKGTQVTASVLRDTFSQHYRTMNSVFFGDGYSFIQNTEIKLVYSTEKKHNTTGQEKTDTFSQIELNQNIDVLNRRFITIGCEKSYQRTINKEKFIQSYTNKEKKLYGDELADTFYNLNFVDKTYYVKQNSSWGTKPFDEESLYYYEHYFPKGYYYTDVDPSYTYYINGNVLTVERVENETTLKSTFQWSFDEVVKYKHINFSYGSKDESIIDAMEFQMKKSSKSVKKYTIKSDYKLVEYGVYH